MHIFSTFEIKLSIPCLVLIVVIRGLSEVILFYFFLWTGFLSFFGKDPNHNLVNLNSVLYSGSCLSILKQDSVSMSYRFVNALNQLYKLYV